MRARYSTCNPYDVALPRTLPLTLTSDSPADSSFAQLHERLRSGLTDLGIIQPTPVQQQAIPAILAGHDVITSAATGTGKSLAFLLPVLHQLMQQPEKPGGCRALIMVPTRELAEQIGQLLKKLRKVTHVEFVQLTGGADFKFQAALLRKNPEVIVATPGRLSDHLRRNSTDLNDLEFWVLDEADRMLDMGFAEDISLAQESARSERQTLLFSATLKHNKVKAIAADLLRDPTTIEAGGTDARAATIKHEYVLTDDAKHKQKALNKLLTTIGERQTLIFTNTKAEANRLRGVLDYYQHQAGCLHGDMTQDQRNQVLRAFRQKKFRVLVATDVAARGLDISGVETVIHFDMARKPEDYIHRAGRTGRAGETGVSIAFIGAPDWDNKARAEHEVGEEFTQRRVPGLEAKYKGPKRIKASGKAAGPKKADVKKREQDTKTTTGKPKAKKRARDAANKGRPKRFGPAPKTGTDKSRPGELGDGFAPLKRKSSD